MEEQLISSKNEESVSLLFPSSEVQSPPGTTRRPRRISSIRYTSECEDCTVYPGSKKIQYLAALGANFGALALGSAYSWSATGLPSLRSDTSIGPVTETEETWIGSILTLGAVAAAPIAGFGVEKIGRRMTMMVLTVPLLIGWLLMYFANSVTMIYVGRFMTGFCSGAFAVAAPIFTAEVADVSIRGMLGAGFDMMITIGQLFIFTMGSFVSWRNQALICGIIPVIIFVLMIFIPESPRFYIEKGKEEKAVISICRLRGADNPMQVEDELSALKKSVKRNNEKSTHWRDLLTLPVMKPVSIGMAMYFFQVISGVDPLEFYTVDIFKSAGASIDEYYSTIIVGVVQVFAAMFGAIIVDRSGRRILLLLSEAILVISLGTLGLYFYLKEQNNGVSPEGLGWLPLTSLIVFVISYSFGIGPIAYMLMGELLPGHVKGLASSVLTSIKWMLSFILTKFFGDFEDALGTYGAFWFFGGFCLLGFFFVLFFVPETQGKTLDEIQRGFANKPGPTERTKIRRSGSFRTYDAI